MKWTDTYDITALVDAHPDVDPKTLRFAVANGSWHCLG